MSFLKTTESDNFGAHFFNFHHNPNSMEMSFYPRLNYSIIFVTMITSSNGNIFRVTGHLWGEFIGPRWIPHTKASDAELWCFLWLRLNKRLSKQSWGWWFETLSCPLWRHRRMTQYLISSGKNSLRHQVAILSSHTVASFILHVGKCKCWFTSFFFYSCITYECLN